MRLKFQFIYIPVLLLVAVSCGKIRQIPPEPYIEFRKMELFDTLEPQLGNPAKATRVTFYFEDGDGDIGINQPVGDETDTLNLFFNAYIKKGGLFVSPDPTDFVQSTSFRIPYIERTGQNKIIQGTVEIILFYYLFNLDDTVKYEFNLKDRAENYSNTAETCVIVFSQLGICEK